MDERWHEIKAIWKQHQGLYILAGFVAGLLAEPFVKALAADALGFLQSLVPEAFGILFTVMIIDSLYRRREATREERELKARLIREMGSSVNEVAKHAAEELRAHGWLADGSLRGIVLERANLQGADLWNADLQDTWLAEANLQKANLLCANLQSAKMPGVDLREANLMDANLQGTHLSSSYLQGASLWGANMQDARLIDSQFDQQTILPNSGKWTHLTDMDGYTDSTRSNFWRSDDPVSPAWRGKEE